MTLERRKDGRCIYYADMLTENARILRVASIVKRKVFLGLEDDFTEKYEDGPKDGECFFFCCGYVVKTCQQSYISLLYDGSW